MEIHIGPNEPLGVVVFLLDRREPLLLKIKSENDARRIVLEAYDADDSGIQKLTWSLDK